VNRPTVCVTLIVKNEGHVIERALASARKHFDAWAIVDTGSTDDTLEAICRATEGWDGQLGQVEWTGFGDARTESLRLAKETGCDYAFVLDADEFIEVPDDFVFPTDGKDLYNITMRLNGVEWPQSRMFRLECGWRYEGVLHEFPVGERVKSAGHIPELGIGTKRDGARSKNPNKYRDDAVALEAAIAEDPGNSRYVFYCGQSWRDAKDFEKAIAWYERRVEMGGARNTAEVVVALNEIAKAMHRLQKPVEAVRNAYLRAYAADPTRAEPLHGLAMLCREHKDFALAWHFATLAAQKPQPTGLFVDSRVYSWLAKDELAIALASLGRVEVAVKIVSDILKYPGLPETERARILGNLSVFTTHLRGESPKAG